MWSPVIHFGSALLIAGACLCEYTDPHCGGKQVIVHLFEWKWSEIALECERFLSKKGFCGVQVSPVNENAVITSPPRPWWERYQPVSYKLETRSGTEADFADMVTRCKNVGVRIYVDVVLNHMAGLGRNGTGTGGSHFNSDKFDFPGVPFIKEHFNPFCPLNAWNDEHMIRDCYLVGLTDLDQSNEYVRNKIAAFLNTLIDYGVAGFRVDAAKHMWPRDITAIQQKLKDLPEGGRPFFYHEVIDQSNGPITSQHYTSLGYVCEFRYCQKIKEGVEDFGRLLGVVDYGWGMTDSEHAFVFVDNHDNQRGHGGGGAVVTFEKVKEYKMAVAFTLANDYGFTRVMSSYMFGDNSDLGPPHNADYSTKEVPVNADGSCGNGWVCEHRWRPIANMAAFRNAVVGTHKENIFNQNNQIAFSRGNKGFFAMARDGHMDQTLQTGLPAGEYCDLITECAKKITVDKNGMAHIVITNQDEPIVAFIVGDATQGAGSVTSSGAINSITTTTTDIPSTDLSNTTIGLSNRTSPAVSVPTGSIAPTESIAPTDSASTGASVTVGRSWSRTVILIERQTAVGEDLFIRGGFDHNLHPECTDESSSSNPCAIPIRDRQWGHGDHFDKYIAWSRNDFFLDWQGAEPGQGTYNGVLAQGTPAVWTTDDPTHPGHSQFNHYGQHYWLVDFDMDCSKTDNGWFELKAVVNNQWEGNIRAGSCTGSFAGAPPAQTGNHWARCGMLNVFHFSSESCEITSIT